MKQGKGDFVMEKIKTIVIVVLVLVIILGGSHAASEISNLRREVKKIEENKQVTRMNQIGIEEYLSLLNGEKVSLIFIGQDNCSFSNAQELVFEELLNTYHIEVNYLNLDRLDEEGKDTLYHSYSEFVTSGISTPTLMLVQKGEIKLYKKGYLSLEALKELLKENHYLE